MWFVMREEHVEARAMLPLTIPWALLQGIALVQLYVQERWVEPPKLDRLPFSLLYHQTMCTLASRGEMTPGVLASRVLSLSYFHRITQDDYAILLRHLLSAEHIQKTETGGLIVGLAGERQTNSYKFYAVFKENEEYTVRNKSQELGTIVMPPPVGEKIALAGHVWIVEEIDHKRHLVYCAEVKGKVPAYFGQCPGDINTKVLEKMKDILRENTPYPYLMKNAAARLGEARSAAVNSGMAEESLICLGGDMWCLFPWLGTYAFLALERFIKIKCAPSLGLTAMDSSRPYFIQLRMKATKEEFFKILSDMEKQPLDPMELIYKGEVPLFEKYDEFLPEELVKKGFAYGILGIDEMKRRIRGWNGEDETIFYGDTFI
jgi:ATP-dependent Lhr-like helicase